MRPEWEEGLRGRLYTFGRRWLPLSWRRAIRRRFAPERVLGIRKPPISIPRVAFDPTALPPGRPDFLILPVIPWSYRRQRPQQLAEAIARRGKRIFYGTLEGDGEATEPTGVAPGVTLLPIEGVRREDPAQRRLEGRSLQSAFDSLARARARFGLLEIALVLETPFWAPLAFLLRDQFGWKVVYDCLDEHSGFGTNRAGALEAIERELVRGADLVLATSEPLRDRLLQIGPDCRLLPNGCDFSLFAGVPDPRPDIDHLVVGYAGAVDQWFDGKLLGEVAKLRPAWTFEIVGGVENLAEPIPTGLNIRHFGERPHAEMASFRSRWDVEIIPFRLTPLTHAVDPVKFYEAAASGRPVVATAMRSLESAARLGLVRLASDPPAFARAIEESASESAATSARRREFARQNTWDVRAGELCLWASELFLHAPIEGGSPSWEDVRALSDRARGFIHFPASIGWNIVLIQRPHHLARAFSRRGFPVVFDIEEDSAEVAPGLTEVEPGLFLWRGSGTPGNRVPNRVLWTFAHNFPDDPMGTGARLVYDIIDHLEVFSGRRRRLHRNHERALREAEQVFAVSAPLLEEVRPSRPDALYLPNGVDCARFAAPPDPAAAPAPLRAAREKGRPIAGYLGAIARWLDLELLVDAARRRPDWTFVLVGEALDESLAKLDAPAPENLLFLGAVPYSAVPSVLSAFDVGLIPFRLGPEGIHSSPIKLYEYLAAGLPVIATPLPECRTIPEVHLAGDSASFAKSLDAARAERGSESYRQRARARAEENDWRHRADVALRALHLAG